MSNATASTCVSAFLSNIVARFGVPAQMVCDNGPAFVSQLFSNLGIKLMQSSLYHPSCHAMVERSFRTLKAALRAHGNPTNWIKNLPLVLLGLRSNVKEDIEASSVHIAYETSLHVPNQFVGQTSLSSEPTTEYVKQLVSFMSRMKNTPQTP